METERKILKDRCTRRDRESSDDNPEMVLTSIPENALHSKAASLSTETMKCKYKGFSTLPFQMSCTWQLKRKLTCNQKTNFYEKHQKVYYILAERSDRDQMCFPPYIYKVKRMVVLK